MWCVCVCVFVRARVCVYVQFLEADEIDKYIKRIEKQREDGDKKKTRKPAASST